MSHGYCLAIAKEAVGTIQNSSPTFGVNGLETAKIVSCKCTQYALSEGLRPMSKDSTFLHRTLDVPIRRPDDSQV